MTGAMRQRERLMTENAKLLCVEQSLESRAVLAHALTDHDLVFAANAFEALQQINRRGFHGYLLEYWLPDLSGAALCRDIRKLDPHAPIIFCTSAARDEVKARALKAGANAFFTKPIDPAALGAKVRADLSVVSSQGLRAEAAAQRAIEAELARGVSHLRERAGAARESAARNVQRTARLKALKAFIEARGTRADFERRWPQMFGSARANHPE